MGKIKWQLVFKAKTSVLFQWYILEGHKAKYFRNSLGIKTSLLNGKIISDEIFIDLNEWAKLEEKFAEEIKSDKKFLSKFIKLCSQHSDGLIKTSKEVGSRQVLQKLDNNQLLSLYKQYQNSVLRLMPFVNGTLVLDSVLKKEITQVLENELKIKEKRGQDLLLSKLIIPKKKSFFVQETESLLKIALKLQKDQKTDVTQDIKEYLDKFAWMTSIAYLRKFQTKEDVVEKINSLLKENPEEKLKQAEQIKKETYESSQRAFEEIKTSPRLIELIELAQEFIYLQTYRMDVFFLAHFYAYPLLETVGKKFSLTVDELVYLTGDEIINLLRGKAKLDKKEVKDRMKDYALIEEDGKCTLVSGDKVKKITHRAVKEIMVKGAVANRGRVTSIVKIVDDIEDMPKVNSGDIIVSVMTHPKLVPAIVKASGIITDLGGILCHAAIVSREFGIPCIVGTKKATKIFKDGDLVELNAYDGVARKL